MLDATCVAMARGGLYDQLGGGLPATPSTPDGWCPHFEKMLYDNAQLLGLYALYAADPQRAAAPEVSYGSLWREFAPVPTYRLAWVPTTGELYAMELSEPDQDQDPVEVLGVLWSRPQVEACLAGWSERCGDQRSLLWARDRIARWRPLVEEAQVTLAPPEPARSPS
jgi:hypothetical protein